jgi:hypothetical protein
VRLSVLLYENHDTITVTCRHAPSKSLPPSATVYTLTASRC